MPGWKREKERHRKEEREKGSGIEKRMSYEMSLVWLLLSSSVQWSLPPRESAVWTKPLMEGANGAAARQSSSHLCKLSLIYRRRKRKEEREEELEGGRM